MVFLCYDFIVFAGWIDREYKNTLEKETILYRWNYLQTIKYQHSYQRTKSLRKF